MGFQLFGPEMCNQGLQRERIQSLQGILNSPCCGGGKPSLVLFRCKDRIDKIYDKKSCHLHESVHD